MNRCTRSRAAACAALLATLPAFSPAQTQIQTQTEVIAAPVGGIIREAPKDVKPARLLVTAPPMITLNGQPDRLSPGARIRNLNNLLVLSGSIVGQELPVVYRRDAAGLVHEAWILTPDEYRKVGGDNADGSKRFAELLALIFSLRK